MGLIGWRFRERKTASRAVNRAFGPGQGPGDRTPDPTAKKRSFQLLGLDQLADRVVCGTATPLRLPDFLYLLRRRPNP
jgi:hypothetical protein